MTRVQHVCSQGNTGREEVLFLRLYLLQSLLSYIEGNDSQARLLLAKVGPAAGPDSLRWSAWSDGCGFVQVESLYGRLCPDSEKMAQLMDLGFTEREARLGLRASGGDLQEAAIHITNRRQVTSPEDHSCPSVGSSGVPLLQ